MRHGPLRHPHFAAFTAAIGAGAVADEVSRLALPLLVLDLTHSLGAAALLRVIQLVPYIALGALAGAVIDRSDKRRLLIAVDAVGIALTAAIPLAAAFGVLTLELIYGLAFLLGTVEVVRGVTTDFGVVPALVQERELTQANAIYLGTDRAARILGPVIAGLAIQASGTANALWVATLAFVPTAVVLLRMPPHLLGPEAIDRAPLGATTLLREIGDGFVFVWRSPILRAVTIFMLLANLGGTGIQTVVLYALSVEQALPAATIGLVFSGIGAMSIVGSVGAPAFTRHRPMGRTMLAAQVVVSLTTLAMGAAGDVARLVLAYAARQVASSAWVVYVFTPRQREVPAALRGRANGAIRTVVLATNAASPALMSAIQAAAGTSAAFVAGGAIGMVAAAVSLFTVLRDYDVRSPEELVALERSAEIEEHSEDPTAVP